MTWEEGIALLLITLWGLGVGFLVGLNVGLNARQAPPGEDWRVKR